VRFLQLLRAAGLAQPVRQYEVRVGDERYFLDFAFPERRLCVELDGEEAHTGAAFQRDRSRQNALVLLGWTVLRFTWADVTERPGQIVALLTQALAA
jgi:very-short-patch-repair endonuclease